MQPHSFNKHEIIISEIIRKVKSFFCANIMNENKLLVQNSDFDNWLTRLQTCVLAGKFS